jgi:hypothetical protein
LQNPFTERAVPITGLAGEVRVPPESELDRHDLRAQRILETKKRKSLPGAKPGRPFDPPRPETEPF